MEYETETLHILDPNAPIADFVRGAQAVLIEHHSNVGLEAMLLHKPVAVLNATADEIIPYLSSHAAFDLSLFDARKFQRFVTDIHLHDELGVNAERFL